MHPVLIDYPWLVLYSYPLFMGLGWGIAFRLTRYLFDKHGSTQNIHLLFWGNFLMAFLGAKIFFLFVSAGENVLLYMESSNFWLGGGFVFYGGFIFAALYTLFLVRLRKVDFKDLALCTIPLVFGHATGRIGCLLAGCCYGTECVRPWSVWLHQANRHPVQIYESVGLYILGFSLLALLNKGYRHFIVPIYLTAYGVLRFSLEFFRADFKRGIWVADLSTSQLVAIVMVGIGLILMVKRLNQRLLPR